jgi:hypothetical protein
VSAGRDPEAVGASDAIFLAFSWLMRPLWYYTGVSTDLTLVSSTGLTAGQEGFQGIYSLPTEVRSPYSLLVGFGLTGAQRPETPLDYIDQRIIDKYRPDSTISPMMYTLFPQGKIRIYAPPSAAGIAEVKYFRRLRRPVEEEDILDVMEGPMEEALIMRAQFHLAVWDGADRAKIRVAQEEAEIRRREARGFDKTHYEEVFTILPPQVWAPRHRALETTAEEYGYDPWGW